MTQPPPPPYFRAFNWRKIVFVLSIGLNIVVIAGVIGFALRSAERRASVAHFANSAVFIRALPHNQRLQLRNKIRQDRAVHNTHLKRSKALNAALFSALTATPFDINALDLTLQKSNQNRHSARAKVDEYWLEVIQQMSPQQRAAYAERLKALSMRRAAKKDSNAGKRP